MAMMRSDGVDVRGRRADGRHVVFAAAVVLGVMAGTYGPEWSAAIGWGAALVVAAGWLTWVVLRARPAPQGRRSSS